MEGNINDQYRKKTDKLLVRENLNPRVTHVQIGFS